MVRPQVHSTKHYVPHDLGTTGAATLDVFTDISAVVVSSSNLSNEVREGATIKAVWVELWITSDAEDQATFRISFEKANSTQSDMTFAESAALFNYKNKKNVLYVTQGLTNPKSGVAMPIYKGWVKIPKSKQRFGLGDQFRINIASQTAGINHCGMTVYKEYY